MEIDLETVVHVYREVRWTGVDDLPAYRAAVHAFCERHPGAERDPATSHRVARLIHEAAERGMICALETAGRTA